MQRPGEVLVSSEYSRIALAGVALGSLVMTNVVSENSEAAMVRPGLSASISIETIGQSAVHYKILVEESYIKNTAANKVPSVTLSPKVAPVNKDILMREAGIPAQDYRYANYIISNESNWCTTKWQGEFGNCPNTYQPIHSLDSSLGYGLGQSTPADKMASFGKDWRTSPLIQLKWANYYAVTHWGSWQNAYNHKVTYGWW
jgi:hypothetical protein